jgi:mediator of RNA polymerase II transcription subunit 8
MSNATTEKERALQSIRSRADHLRHTVLQLESRLAWYPLTQWPYFLSQFQVISKQLENILALKDDEDLPESMHHFVCMPRMATPNAADIPQLLRTREDPEMEKHDETILSGGEKCNPLKRKAAEWTWEELEEMKQTHADMVDTLEKSFKESADVLLKEIRAGKFQEKPKPTQGWHPERFKYMETGQW